MSVSYDTPTSSSVRAHSWLMLPMRVIWPFGTLDSAPETSRTSVVRRLMPSTTPTIPSPASITSPIPYWSSASMNTPARKSETRSCAPKPTASPMIPAPAISGARLIPNTPRIMNTAMVSTITLARLRSSVPRASARVARRFDVAVVRPRILSGGVFIWRTTRSISRFASHLTTSAITTTSRICSAGSIRNSITSAVRPSPNVERTQSLRGRLVSAVVRPVSVADWASTPRVAIGDSTGSSLVGPEHVQRWSFHRRGVRRRHRTSVVRSAPGPPRSPRIAPSRPDRSVLPGGGWRGTFRGLCVVEPDMG